MPQKQLEDALAALHDELESAEEISLEERAALAQAVDEIRDALARGADREPPALAEGSLSGRLSALMEDFETSHPRFAEVLKNLSESLANLGI